MVAYETDEPRPRGHRCQNFLPDGVYAGSCRSKRRERNARKGQRRRQARRSGRLLQPEDRRLPERAEEVVKIRGEFVWHSHPDTDDFFFVLRGRLTIQLEDGDVELSEGEMFIVPRGVRHCPRADEEAHVLLIEPKGTPNTGDAGGDLTAVEEEI